MATQPAAVGLMRVGNARLGYESAALRALRTTRVRVMINGVLSSTLTSATRVLMKNLTIRDVINETPSTASFTARGTSPTVAQSVRVTINSDTPRLLFNGAIQKVTTSYGAGKPATANYLYPCSATDDLERLKRRRPFGTWTNISATTIVQELVASFAPGFTTTHVQASLPLVSMNLDGSEGFDGALKQLANLIGGYYYIDDLDIHLFQDESTDLPDAITSTAGPQTSPAVTVDTDLSQIRTRVYGKGHGETVPTDVGIGETILPVANAESWFNPAGGSAIAETQRVTYTGIQLGGAGSLVGPGAAPSVAASAVADSGAGLNAGTYQHAYTWVTGSGETLPSPMSSAVTAVYAAPAGAPSIDQHDYGLAANNSAYVPGDTVQRVITYSYATSITDYTRETAASPVATVTAVVSHSFPTQANGDTVTIPHSSETGIRWVRLWRNVNVGPTYALVGWWANVPGTSTVMGDTGNAQATTLPSANATAERVVLTGVAVGPSGTTSRKLYRTVVGGAQLKLVATIADNTTTTYTDSTADGSLGANVPTSDTSGLTVTTGQVNAGSTSLLLASAGPFATTGGWAILGSQAVRYTGISGNTLTGIPASGVGALLNSVRYGEHVDPAPALTGVTGIVVAISSGTPVNVWVQRDDTAAQAAMAALDGGDGIYEYLVSDERRTETSLTALADAHLQIYSRPIVTVHYATHDVKTKSGKPVTFTSVLGYTGTLTIQDVAIDAIDQYDGLAPRFTATASSVRVSLEAVLKSLVGEGA